MRFCRSRALIWHLLKPTSINSTQHQYKDGCSVHVHFLSFLYTSQLTNDALSFVGPLLLKLLVDWLAQGTPASSQPNSTADMQAGMGGTSSLGDSALDHSKGPVSSLAMHWPPGTAQWQQWLQQLWGVLLSVLHALGPRGSYWGVTLACGMGATAAVRALLSGAFNWRLVCVYVQGSLVLHHWVTFVTYAVYAYTCLVKWAAEGIDSRATWHLGRVTHDSPSQHVDSFRHRNVHSPCIKVAPCPVLPRRAACSASCARASWSHCTARRWSPSQAVQAVRPPAVQAVRIACGPGRSRVGQARQGGAAQNNQQQQLTQQQ